MFQFSNFSVSFFFISNIISYWKKYFLFEMFLLAIFFFDKLTLFRTKKLKSAKNSFGSLTKQTVESSNLRLNVPSILIESHGKNSEVSLVSLASSSSISDAPSTPSDVKPMIDIETISMILRNVEELEKLEAAAESDVVATSSHVDSAGVPLSDKSPHKSKKHYIFRDLKTKLNHLSENLKRHDSIVRKKQQSESQQHGKMHNVSGKLHQIAEKVHNFHLPHLHHQNPSESLVGTAMQNMLMDNLTIVEAMTEVTEKPTRTRKISTTSLGSIKQKLNMFARRKQSQEVKTETENIKSIAENAEKKVELPSQSSDDSSSSVDSIIRSASVESLVTVVANNDDLSSFSGSLASFCPSNASSYANTNTNQSPLHESLLSFTRSDQHLLSASPNSQKTHIRTESSGAKFSASPQRISNSLGKDQGLSSIHRRSSDSDLSITPKGELFDI